MVKLNPFDHPVCFVLPNRLTRFSAWQEHIPFAMFLVDLLRPKTLVELGTQYGDSYCAFCQAVKELKVETYCYAIDTWKGDPQAGFYGPEVLADLRSHHDPLYGSFSRLIQSSFDAALQHFGSGTIDILHIDGYHSYAAVKHDFESWLPKVSTHGVVLLHDINVRESDYGVREFWEEIKVQYPHFEFLHCHGLGIIAVGRVHPNLQPLLVAADQDVIIIRDFFFQLGQQITKNISLKVSLEEKTNKISDIAAALQAKDARINEFEIQMKEFQKQARELNNALQDKDTKIMALETEIEQMRRGILLQLLHRYHRVIEKLLPSSTRRRYYYGLGLIGLRTIINEGLINFWWKYRQYRASKKIARVKIKQPIKLETLSGELEEKVDTIKKTVSIVIPTKDAGQDFHFTLEKINNQQGIMEIEIIVVDSGSIDGTIKLAEKHGAKVYTTKPKDFNHGLTRNYGAAKANGDYILFMVQDAISIGNHWLYDMVKVLEFNSKIAAATVRQVPRSNTDLFACFLLWNHYRELDFSKDMVSVEPKFNDLSPIETRRLAGLENVCCLIRKDLFNNFKFKEIKYAEDLELGLRMIKSGYQIAFLHSVGVIHAHNRSPSYLLKRSYVDNKILPIILSYEPVCYSANYDVYEVFGYVTMLYAALNASIESWEPFGEDVGDNITKLKTSIKKNLKSDPLELKGFERSGDYLDDIFDKIQEIVGAMRLTSNDLFFQQYLKSLDIFAMYMEAYSTIKGKEGEFLSSLYKLLAIAAGSAFANHYLHKSKGKEITDSLVAVDGILSEGI
ncbi:class I SAM-dependent methyltransferase [Chloroflexota bacterium]